MSQSINSSTKITCSDICAIIPTYNNSKTILKVITDVGRYINDIIVIDDGSSDETQDIIKNIENITISRFNSNKGKGAAIKRGFEIARSNGFDYALTIDSDGQHFADDIPSFIETINKSPNSLIIGSRNIEADGMPSKNSFANKFSNFWFWVETNQKLPDTQSGFRLYPINQYEKTKFFTNRFEFEVEVLVRSSWSEIPVIPIPVKVYYAPDNERVTHFRPMHDFTRISILNTVLVLITALYILPLKLLRYIKRNKFTRVVKEQILLHNNKPINISLAIGFGIFMGIVPIWGFQMIVAALLAHLFRLNKIIVLAFSNISVPPVIPFIVYFSYEIGGLVTNNSQNFTPETINYLKEQILHGGFYNTLSEFGYSILQYVIGSFILATIMGALAFGISYFVVLIAKGKNK